METLILRPKEERRIRRGHLWVFSNEVAAPPAGGKPGELVRVLTHTGESLGSALYHPHSLISARLLGTEAETLDEDFFRQRLSAALRLRQCLFPEQDGYRLVHGESDFLPGLIVDRFGDHLVLQTLSWGMDTRKELICDILEELLKPRAIVERNDTPLRLQEGLPQQVGTLRGEAGEAVEIVENQLRFRVDLLHGQKTGFFLDQKLNRLALRRYASGRKVLDCFCNAGGFALNAARAGARSVTAVEISEPALRQARLNAQLNQLEGIEFCQADVFTFLEQRLRQGERYEVIVLDPPSFTRNRKSVPSARKAYRKLNELACRLLEPGGFLWTASCSFHLYEEVFYQVVQEAAFRAGRRLQLLERRQQSPDHPILPGMPETRYLKLGVFRVSSR